MAAAQPRTPWGGAPAKLIRKTPLVEEVPGVHLAVYTLTFQNPPNVHSLGCRIDFGDVVKVCVPGYKPKSYSMSAMRPGEFDITFKVYPNGRASGYLDSIKVGETIDVFVKGQKTRNPGSRVGLIAYGVGITEILPMAAAELSKPEAQSVILLWASRRVGDTFWHGQLNNLKTKYGDKFEFITILSREEGEGSLHGRVTANVLSSVFVNRWGIEPGGNNYEERAHVRFLAIGTKEMMRATDLMFESLGFTMMDHYLLLK